MHISWRRPLYLTHRWLGIVLCAFFALWFFSGIFMMYVEFPQLTPPERRAGLPPLDFSRATLAPGAAVAALRAGDFDSIGDPHRNRRAEIGDPAAPVKAASIRLGMLLERPVYVVTPESGAQPATVYADDGVVADRIDADTAVAAAEGFVARRVNGTVSLRYAGMVQTDQWTVSAALNPHRPLHHVVLDGDAAGRELYVSSTTGEVVRDTHRNERLLNYAAAVSHWLYPTLIRRHAELWAWMVIVLSGAGALLAVSGLWVGLHRWRWRAARGVARTPYRGLMRWHHLIGLAFGVVALTWVFSGLLSMNPADLNPSRSPTAQQREVYSGKPLTPADFTLPAWLYGTDIVEAELLHYDGRPYYVTTTRDGTVGLHAGNDRRGAVPTVAALRARAHALLPDAPLLHVDVLHDYDDYWYTRHPERGGRALPVLRIQFGDDARTWFYADPVTGRLLERSTRVNRVYRWLYNGLHSWDIRWLWERRPLWDIAVILFSLGGLALSVTGVITGWRYLRMERKRTRMKARAAAMAKHAAVGG